MFCEPSPNMPVQESAIQLFTLHVKLDSSVPNTMQCLYGRMLKRVWLF